MVIRQRAGILEVLTPIIPVFKAALDDKQANPLVAVST
jgi:hypothetical protein